MQKLNIQKGGEDHEKSRALLILTRPEVMSIYVPILVMMFVATFVLFMQISQVIRDIPDIKASIKETRDEVKAVREVFTSYLQQKASK